MPQSPRDASPSRAEGVNNMDREKKMAKDIAKILNSDQWHTGENPQQWERAVEKGKELGEVYGENNICLDCIKLAFSQEEMVLTQIERKLQRNQTVCVKGQPSSLWSIASPGLLATYLSQADRDCSCLQPPPAPPPPNLALLTWEGEECISKIGTDPCCNET
ncbi:unnamed protein product [Caretta caretta]